MIYKSSYFKKELRQAYIENKISLRKQFLLGLFIGLTAIAVHFVLQTMIKSVLSDAIPHVMQQSYFSTLYAYTQAALFIYLLNFLILYDALSFSEIRKNRWYLLVKMGYSPIYMIFAKISALLYSVWFVYTAGFVMTLLLTAVLKYRFIVLYVPNLYLVGLLDLFLLSIIIVTASLFFKQRSACRYFALFAYAAILVMRHTLGYQQLISDRALMQDVFFFFSHRQNFYWPVALAVIVFCLIVCFFKAGDIAKYYSVTYENFARMLPENTKLVVRDRQTGRMRSLIKPDLSARRSKIFDMATTTILAIVICLAVTFNIFVILISTAQPGKEVTIRGIIPYIFVSETMQPTIKINDLAFFRRVDPYEPVNVGDIVLFQDDNTVYVERVVAIQDGKYTVDIDYYPPQAQKGAMVKTIDRAAIYGVHTSSSRWLGALILFANTIAGRMVFLLIPVLLLFYSKKAKAIFLQLIEISDDRD